MNVAVTGLGATTPLGGDVPSTWSALLAGESGVSRSERTGRRRSRCGSRPGCGSSRPRSWTGCRPADWTAVSRSP